MGGILLSYWGGLFSGAMLVSGRVIFPCAAEKNTSPEQRPVLSLFVEAVVKNYHNQLMKLKKKYGFLFGPLKKKTHQNLTGIEINFKILRHQSEINQWHFLVGGWTNPFEKYARQIGSFAQVRAKKNKYLKPPPSFKFGCDVFPEPWLILHPSIWLPG